MNSHLPKRITVISSLVLMSWVVVVCGFAAVESNIKYAGAAECIPDAKLVNPCRPWSGVWANNYVNPYNWKNSIVNYESRVGRQADIVHHYHAPTTIAISADEKNYYNRANTYLYLNWKPDTTWGNAGGGNATVNTRIDQKADAIKALGSKKIFLTIFHEPENDITPGAANSSCSGAKGNSGSTAQYRAMWQNVRNRFDARGVNNVVWVMNYMGYSGWDCAVKDLWPGNNLVDWIVWDPYSGNNVPYITEARHFYDVLTNNTDSTHNFTSKPWGYGEFGFNGSDQAKAYKYYDDMKASVQNNTLPKVKMYLVFDALGIWDTRTNYTSTGQLDNTEQQRYNAVVNTILGTATPPTPPPPPPPPPTDTTPPAGTITTPTWNATVSGTVAIQVNATDNVGVAKVQFFIDENNNAVFAEDATAPYTAQWNSTQVSNGQHTIRAKVIDTAGNTKTPAMQVNVSNAGPPAQPKINSFSASPSTVTVGNASTLSWSTANATTCSITPNGPVDTTFVTWKTPNFNSTGTYNYTLTCKNQVGQTASATTSVVVNPAPTPPAKPTFTADKTAVQRGGSVTLNWSSAAATGCVLNPGNFSSSGSTGSKLVTNVSATTTYTLNCSNNAGTTPADPVTVTVTEAPPAPAAPVIVSLTATPGNIEENTTSTIKWSTSNVVANGCSLMPSPLTTTSGNGEWTTPVLNTSASYTLTCKNAANQSVSKSISVIVAGKPAPPAPAPSAPSTAQTDKAQQQTVRSDSGQTIVNAQSRDKPQQGDLITLDPSNVTDSEKIKNIRKVEYYVDDKLVQSITSPPYALDTKLLGVGEFTVTERVYFADGSYTVKTQTITVVAKADKEESPVVGSAYVISAWLGGISVMAFGTLTLLAYLFRGMWLPYARQHLAWLDHYMNTRELSSSINNYLQPHHR